MFGYPGFREVGGDYPNYFDLSSSTALKEKLAGLDLRKATHNPQIPTGEVLTWKESSRLLMKKLHEQSQQPDSLS
ncbi:MAG: hypothetical protein IPK68_15340 [Bdellovibrionales bacterium]|nr:hypothetical protein [Bdellovibrionales bacterium]